MALGGKTSKKFYVTSGGGNDEINSTRKTALDAFNTADSAAGYKQLIDDNTLGPLIVNLQEMQDDIDELRRFVASSAEIKGTIGTLPIANGGTGMTSSQPLIYSEITISAPEMAALNTTRKTLVSAPGANKIIIPVSIMIRMDKLNTTNNTTLSSLYAGYYDSDNRDIVRNPTHKALGILYRTTIPASRILNESSSAIHKDSFIQNKELAMVTDTAVGSDGATTSKVCLLYYIASVT